VEALPAAVTAAIGSAVLGEDLCGDLVAARAAVERLPDDAFARGVVDVLSGRPADALRRLAQGGATRTSTGADDLVAARRRVWWQYAKDLDQYVLPGGGTTYAVELMVRMAEAATPDGPAPFGAMDGSVPDPTAADGSADPEGARIALERLVAVEIAPSLRFARAWIHTDPPELRTDVVTHLLGAIDRLRDLAGAAGDLATQAASERLRAEVLWRGGRGDDAATVLAAARRDADARDDDASRAAVALLTGDLALAPVSHPFAGGGVLRDSGSATSQLSWADEELEGDLSRVDVAVVEAAYVEAAGWYERLGAVRGLAATAIRRAVLARLAGDGEAAHHHADQAVGLAADAGDLWLQRAAELELLATAIATGRPTATSPIPERIGDWGARGGSFAYAFGLGLALMRTGRQWLVRHGDPDRAAATHRLAGRLFAALGAPTQVSQCRADEAEVYSAVEDLPAAAEAYDDALAGHLQRHDDPLRGTDAWLRAGLVALARNGLAVRINDARTLRQSMGQLRALQTAAPTDPEGDPVGLARHLAAVADDTEVLVLLAESDRARDEGDDRAALEQATLAAELARRRGSDLALAAALHRLGRTAEAGDAFRSSQAAAVARQTEELAAHGDRLTPERRAEFEHAGVRFRLREAAAFATRLGDAAWALASFEELDQRAPGWASDDPRPWELLSDRGRAYALAGDRHRAAEQHAAAVAALRSSSERVSRDEQRVGLQADSTRVFGRAASNLLLSPPLGEHAAERSFALVESGRARSLTDLLATVHGSLGDLTAADGRGEALRRWAAASAGLSLWQQLVVSARGAGAEPEEAHPDAQGPQVEWLRSLVARSHEARHELAEATDALRAVDPAVATLLTPGDEPTVSAVSACLAPDRAFVSYLVVDDDLLVYAVTHAGLAVAERIPGVGPDLTRALRSFSSGCASGGEWTAAGRDAARHLLDPVADVLAGVDRLYLVPTGLGHAAPLHALPWQDGLLGDDVTIAVLPSAATLLHLPPGPGPLGGGAFVVGDPEHPVLTTGTGDTIPMDPLPIARLEAAAVAARLGTVGDEGASSSLLLGPAATTAAVRDSLASAGLAHLATHVHVDPRAPLSSAVLLAHGGLLRVADLVGMRLTADLVVLSACDSGRGPITGGDEVVSMIRAVLGAGARSAVGSLWPVRDLSTGLLMTRFAHELADGADPATGLQRAQRWYRALDDAGRREAAEALLGSAPPPSEDLDRGGLVTGGVDVHPAHPFHWAAFVYVGPHPSG
jgi:CHAT domain-containing protein/tetratricopeptide (TPR) repeat protein